MTINRLLVLSLNSKVTRNVHQSFTELNMTPLWPAVQNPQKHLVKKDRKQENKQRSLCSRTWNRQMLLKQWLKLIITIAVDLCSSDWLFLLVFKSFYIQGKINQFSPLKSSHFTPKFSGTLVNQNPSALRSHNSARSPVHKHFQHVHLKGKVSGRQRGRLVWGAAND